MSVLSLNHTRLPFDYRLKSKISKRYKRAPPLGPAGFSDHSQPCVTAYKLFVLHADGNHASAPSPHVVLTSPGLSTCSDPLPHRTAPSLTSPLREIPNHPYSGGHTLKGTKGSGLGAAEHMPTHASQLLLTTLSHAGQRAQCDRIWKARGLNVYVCYLNDLKINK